MISCMSSFEKSVLSRMDWLVTYVIILLLESDFLIVIRYDNTRNNLVFTRVSKLIPGHVCSSR